MPESTQSIASSPLACDVKHLVPRLPLRPSFESSPLSSLSIPLTCQCAHLSVTNSPGSSHPSFTLRPGLPAGATDRPGTQPGILSRDTRRVNARAPNFELRELTRIGRCTARVSMISAVSTADTGQYNYCHYDLLNTEVRRTTLCQQNVPRLTNTKVNLQSPSSSYRASLPRPKSLGRGVRRCLQAARLEMAHVGCEHAGLPHVEALLAKPEHPPRSFSSGAWSTLPACTPAPSAPPHHSHHHTTTTIPTQESSSISDHHHADLL
eukprot:1541847-Rhodomonas_salina.2